MFCNLPVDVRWLGLASKRVGVVLLGLTWCTDASLPRGLLGSALTDREESILCAH